MNNKHYLVIDFETKDPYISRGYGAGWTFNINHDKEDFKLLGAAVYDSNTGKTTYYTDLEEVRKAVTSCKTWVFFNAQYDVGCILSLFKGDDSFDLEDYRLIDTQIMAKLYVQDMYVWSLDECCKRFDVDVQKDKGIIGDYAWESGLYQIHKQIETKRKVHKRPADNLLNKWAIQNLDLLPDSVVGEYCVVDVEATNALYEFLDSGVTFDEDLFSDLIKVCIGIRLRGTHVDIKKAKEVSRELLLTETAIVDEVNKEFGLDININSPYQLGSFLEIVGVDSYPRTPLGNPSITTDYLRDSKNEWANKLAEARLCHKMRTSFVDKIIDYQGFDDNLNGDVGVMYLSHYILGATQTGRFTSGAGGRKSFELNIQQIPSPKTKIGKLCRSMFLPVPGEKWVSADFSSQESRIQLHYAAELACEGATEVELAWNKNPDLDFHQKVADITGLDRGSAKAINFGLSYGMGPAKLCESLGLPTARLRLRSGKVIPIAGPQGNNILEQYHEMVPFMKQAITEVNGFMAKQGYVMTVGGRKLKLNPYISGDSRRGFSKLIQGSGADMTMIALVKAHKAGLHILNTVHDEINISSSDPEKDAKVLTNCMEGAILLRVPMKAGVKIANDWGDCK